MSFIEIQITTFVIFSPSKNFDLSEEKNSVTNLVKNGGYVSKILSSEDAGIATRHKFEIVIFLVESR